LTLPIQPKLQDDESQLQRRDEIYDKIKHHLPPIHEKSAELKKELIKLVLDDMVLDHALSEAVDEIGMVLEYQAQAESIERPRFNGMGLIKDVERIGKLDFSIRLAKMLGLDEDAIASVRLAEIDRLWGEGTVAKGKKDSPPQLKLPDEIYSVLREVTKALSKRTPNAAESKPGARGSRGTASGPVGTVNGPK